MTMAEKVPETLQREPRELPSWGFVDSLPNRTFDEYRNPKWEGSILWDGISMPVKLTAMGEGIRNIHIELGNYPGLKKDEGDSEMYASSYEEWRLNQTYSKTKVWLRKLEGPSVLAPRAKLTREYNSRLAGELEFKNIIRRDAKITEEDIKRKGLTFIADKNIFDSIESLIETFGNLTQAIRASASV